MLIEKENLEIKTQPPHNVYVKQKRAYIQNSTKAKDELTFQTETIKKKQVTSVTSDV